MSEPGAPAADAQRKTALILAGTLGCGALLFASLFCAGIVAGVVHKGMTVQRPAPAPPPSPIEFEF